MFVKECRRAIGIPAALLMALLAGPSWSQQLPSYIVTSVAGGTAPPPPGLATDMFMMPTDVASDGFGNLYFSFENGVYKIYPSGTIARIAGYRNSEGYSGDGGLGTNAMLSRPQSIVADPAGNVYIADFGNGAIRKVNVDGVITTVGFGVLPLGLALDRLGNLYVTDPGKNTISKITPGGVTTTIAGTGTQGFGGDGGPAVFARLNQPKGIGIDAAGNIYFSDSANDRVRKSRQTALSPRLLEREWRDTPVTVGRPLSHRSVM